MCLVLICYVICFMFILIIDDIYGNIVECYYFIIDKVMCCFIVIYMLLFWER